MSTMFYFISLQNKPLANEGVILKNVNNISEKQIISIYIEIEQNEIFQTMKNFKGFSSDDDYQYSVNLDFEIDRIKHTMNLGEKEFDTICYLKPVNRYVETVFIKILDSIASYRSPDPN